MQFFNVRVNLNNTYTILIILMPILNIYSFGVNNLGIGDLLATILFLLLFISSRGKISLNNNKYGYFAFYFVFVSFCLLFLLPEYSLWQFFSKCFRFGLYTALIFCFAKNRFNVKFGIKIYIYVSAFAAIYLIIQYFCKTFFSISLPILIPFLNVMFSDLTGEAYSERLLNMYSLFGYRAPGFFMEPAHFCQYVMPSVVVLLFCTISGVKRNIALLLMITSIILSYSAIGFVSLVSTFLIWYFYTFKQRLISNNLIVLILGLTAAVYISIATGAFASALSRIETIQSTQAATGNLRLLRGFYVYNEVPLVYKIIGIGCGNYSAFIDKFNINTFFDLRIDRYSEYMSTISTVLLNSGVIGIVLYINSLISIYRKTSIMQKVLFVDFIIIITATSSFFSALYVFYMVFLIVNSPEADKIAI